MSTGTKGNFDVFSGGYLGSYDTYRNWSGNDGRTESTSTGGVRSKWNNFTMRFASRRCSSNLWTATLADGSTRTFASNRPLSVLSGEPSLEPLRLTAQSRLAEKVRGHSFNLAVNVAQGRQLIDMVTSNLGKLGRSILALKRGDITTAARQLGARPPVRRQSFQLAPSDISGRWLELQYGWLPLLSDSYEAAKAYWVLTRDNRVSTVRSSAWDVKSYNSAAEGPTTAQAILVQKRRVIYTVELSESLSAERSLGLSDPLSVVWEIIPYSFVVDWFIPIGTYLDTLSILPHLTGRWMETQVREQSAFSEIRWVGSLPSFPNSPVTKKVEFLGSDVGRVLLINRSVGLGALTVSHPGFSWGLRGTRVWNAIALAAQRFI